MAKRKKYGERPYKTVRRALREKAMTIKELSMLVYGGYDRYYHNCIYLKILSLRKRGYIVECIPQYEGNRKRLGLYRLKRGTNEHQAPTD